MTSAFRFRPISTRYCGSNRGRPRSGVRVRASWRSWNAECRGDERSVGTADDLSDPMVVATTASQGLRHGSVSGTLGFPLRARAAGEGDFPFDYRRVAVANMSLVNVCGRSSATMTCPSISGVIEFVRRACEFSVVGVATHEDLLARFLFPTTKLTR